MSIVQLMVILMVIGLLLWLVNTFFPMDPKIKQILNVAVVVLVILWLLNLFVPFFQVTHIRVR